MFISLKSLSVGGVMKADQISEFASIFRGLDKARPQLGKPEASCPSPSSLKINVSETEISLAKLVEYKSHYFTTVKL